MSSPPGEAWFKRRSQLWGGWGRRPKGETPRSEAGALGARWLLPARPQPPRRNRLRSMSSPCGPDLLGNPSWPRGWSFCGRDRQRFTLSGLLEFDKVT